MIYIKRRRSSINNDVFEKRAALLIEALYGSPPDENSETYKFYSEAVRIETEFLKKTEVSGGLKKLTLGDSSEEYFDGGDSSSSDVICENALILLDKVYNIRHVSVL